MFNGGYNPITNVLADCSQASVVLLEDGTLRISGKVVFPYEKRILRDAVEGTKIPDPVPPADGVAGGDGLESRISVILGLGPSLH